MSPGNTMARVYVALKEQVVTGAHAPGDRLDPGLLAQDLSASVTPVREALHRLAGERLVESWHHEGFRIPLVTEAGLRDLYAWSLEAAIIVIRGMRRLPPVQHVEDPDDDFGRILYAIANLSTNFEHRAALISVADRGASIRRVEIAILGDADELNLLADAVGRGSWQQVVRGLTGYYRRRVRAAVQIASVLRPERGG